jgi:hypothetical protein
MISSNATSQNRQREINFSRDDFFQQQRHGGGLALPYAKEAKFNPLASRFMSYTVCE